MNTSPSTHSIIWLMSFGSLLVFGCSSTLGNADGTPVCGQACASAGTVGVSSGGSTSAIGGTGATGTSGGTASTGGVGPIATGGSTSATGGTSVTSTGGSTSATGGKASTGGSTSATGGTSTTSTGGSSSTGTAGSSNTPARCSTVPGAVAKTLVTNGAILLDVRSASEFTTNGLPGAVNIPLAELAARMSELDKSKDIVVYCASGSRSGQANTQLCTAGYNVFNLGPLTNWPQ